MSSPNQQYIADLLATPMFVSAMETALAGRLRSLNEEVRQAVRSGDLTRAALAEGKLYATETILGTLQSYTKASQPRG
jgi:hypothetical protein